MSGVKYQVFISSTYDDLREERETLVKAILEMGHIPVGMEMFSAADEEQWQIIQRHIDDSDYYIIVIAHRYGSIFNGISYTEREYDYAVSKGVPTLGFIIQPQALWPVHKVEAAQQGAISSFKEKVQTKPVGFWENAQHLYGLVPIALMKQMTAHPRPGWIRGTSAASPEMLAEMSSLSAENRVLRELTNTPKPPDLALHLTSAGLSLSDSGRKKPDATVYFRAQLFISNRDGRVISIPLDHIAGQVRSENCEASLTNFYLGSDTPQILISDPAAVFLYGTIAPAPDWLLTCPQVELSLSFKALGFSGHYTVSGQLSGTGGEWKFPSRSQS